MKIFTKIFSAGAVALCFLFAGQGFGQHWDKTVDDIENNNSGKVTVKTSLWGNATGTSGSSKVLKVESDEGYALIGAQNNGFLHIQTDRQYFHFKSNSALANRGSIFAGKVGIGSMGTVSDNLHISSGTDGNVSLLLEADTDNDDEYDNPLIKMRQDGDLTGVNIGFDENNFGENVFGIGKRYGAVDSWNTFGINMENGNVGIGVHSVALSAFDEYKFTVRGGPAYFNAIPHGGSTDANWSTAVIVGINSDSFHPTDDNPDREMRLLQAGPLNSTNYGAGISFGLAPRSDDKWNRHATSGQQFLIKYTGGAIWIQGAFDGPGTVLDDNHTNGWSLNDGNPSTNTSLNNLIRISDLGSPNHLFGIYENGWALGNWYKSSDLRMKKNISTIERASDKVMALRGTTYQYNEKVVGNIFGDNMHIGFIAQELKEVLPELISQQEDGYYSIDYDGVIPVLVEAFKELNEKNETQQELIEAQNEKIAMLERKLSMLEGGETTIGTSSANLSSGSELSAAAEVISLSQNRPNPFSESTMIEYFLPESVNQAMIFIYDMNGKQLKEMPLMEKGRGSVTINGGALNAGMYLYALIADGREVDVKRMILTK